MHQVSFCRYFKWRLMKKKGLMADVSANLPTFNLIMIIFV
ncbi:hypothetical protein PSM_A0965 [Pseudoalteromonas sp. SM9913]|nr:hypothetical protein PSM_A0965 [Pseudoalteromonas sp. SM9913]